MQEGMHVRLIVSQVPIFSRIVQHTYIANFALEYIQVPSLDYVSSGQTYFQNLPLILDLNWRNRLNGETPIFPLNFEGHTRYDAVGLLFAPSRQLAYITMASQCGAVQIIC